MLSFIEFMENKVGPKWVVARRDERAKHSEDTVCISRRRYESLRAEFKAGQLPLSADVRTVVEHLKQACETGANFIEFYQKRPDELRAWAARIERGFAPKSVSLPVLRLRGAAGQAEEFLKKGS